MLQFRKRKDVRAARLQNEIAPKLLTMEPKNYYTPFLLLFEELIISQSHYTQKDYRTELYYFRIIFGNSCSVITEPICFWN